MGEATAAEGSGAADAGGLSRKATSALYVGGLLGPMGSTIVSPMFPELRETFDVTSSQAALSLSFYLFPYAILLLISGTIGERLGRRRVVRTTYIGYAIASFAGALAPTLPLFLAVRLVQGVGNAFTTPLLLAGLAESTPSHRLGKSMGIYASFQAAGVSIAPFAGGIAADINWRYAFVGLGLVCVALSFFPPPGEARADGNWPSFRSLRTKRMAVCAIAGIGASLGPIGVNYLVAFKARDVLGLSASQAGLVLVGGGVGGFLMSPLWGRLIDRIGAAYSGAIGALLGALAVASISLIDSTVPLAAAWVVAGTATGLISATIQQLAATAVPSNRGGALSTVLSARFFGFAISPLIWLPVYTRSQDLAFLLSAATALIAITAYLALQGPRFPTTN